MAGHLGVVKGALLRTCFVVTLVGVPQARAEPGAAIVAKMEGIVIPRINFEDVRFEEAIDYLRVKSLELDREPDAGFRGFSMLIERGTREGEDPGDGLAEEGGRGLGLHLDSPKIKVYRAKDVSLREALVECCRLANMEAYITNVGIVICPAGREPFPNGKARRGEVLRKLTSKDGGPAAR